MKPTLFLISALLIIAPAAAQDFHWSGSLAPGRTLEIKNVNGSIIATASPNDKVEVTAIKSGTWGMGGGNPDLVRIEVVESEAGVTICAVHPDGGLSTIMNFFLEMFWSVEPTYGKNICKPGDAGSLSSTGPGNVKVEFTVRVPKSVRFSANSVNGGLRAHGLSGDVRARTVNGGISIATAGFARASTVNGRITATLGSLPEAAEFSSVNGAITVELPSGTPATVEARTVNGRIESDFPVAISGRAGGRRMSGAIAGGGPRLSLKTVNGRVSLRQRILTASR